ncbi:MAG: carbon-nitrogen hydrolase family protein, partial [Microthrixaceae bacterium]|nr:carbon-nitrogen hydrolase family protein [Microthrixaceae bacterium]
MNSRSSVERTDAPNLVTVACVNFAAASGSDGSTSKAARLEKVLRQTRDAHRQGAQLVVFPEGALGAVGPDCTECSVDTGPCADHVREAEQVPGPSTDALSDLAIELGVYIVFGIDEADPDNPARLYNSAVLV